MFGACMSNCERCVTGKYAIVIICKVCMDGNG